ncbi:hypothetical protein AVEN_4040-1, partial [Araneus ventricosus]
MHSEHVGIRTSRYEDAWERSCLWIDIIQVVLRLSDIWVASDKGYGMRRVSEYTRQLIKTK